MPISQQKAVLILVITAILWSTSGFLIKLVDWNPLAIAGSRSAIAGIFLLLITKRPHWRWNAAQIGGGIAYAAMVILFVTANKLTTAANVILIQYTAPIYIALFSSWFLGEKTKSSDWIIIAIVIFGLLLFFIDDLSTTGLLGNICALLSGISLAWLFLFMRKQKDESTIESVILGNFIAAFVGLPFMFQTLPNSEAFLVLPVLGIFQLGIPYFLFSIAIKQVTALEAILIPIIEPILNPIWVVILVGEIPGFWAILGGIIVISAVTFRGMLTVFVPRFEKIEKSVPQS
jgi:drug/metabolite transporter (DMT)-like permease